MAAITGITAAISWVGTENAYLASTGQDPARFTLDYDGDDFDATTLATTGSEAHLKGLTSLSGTWTGQLKAAAHGAEGLITFSAGTVLNANSWDMEIVRAAHEVTAFAATAKAYIPGVWGATGSFGGFLDDTTASVAISNANEPATGTFKYQEKGATDNTLSGSIFTFGGSVNVSVQPNTYSYRYRMNGDITHSIPSAGVGILPNGAIVGSAAGSLVLTASTGRTFTTNAFWTRIGISCRVGALTEVTVGWRSSDGTLAIG